MKKTKFRKTIPTKDKKGSIQQQILEQKNTFLAIQVENNHVPKKVILILFRNFAGDFFSRRRIFADFKTRFSKVSRISTYIPISRRSYGEIILSKIIRKPRFCYERWSTSAQSMAYAQSIARIDFAAKKGHNVDFSV